MRGEDEERRKRQVSRARGCLLAAQTEAVLNEPTLHTARSRLTKVEMPRPCSRRQRREMCGYMMGSPTRLSAQWRTRSAFSQRSWMTPGAPRNSRTIATCFETASSTMSSGASVCQRHSRPTGFLWCLRGWVAGGRSKRVGNMGELLIDRSSGRSSQSRSTAAHSALTASRRCICWRTQARGSPPCTASSGCRRACACSSRRGRAAAPWSSGTS